MGKTTDLSLFEKGLIDGVRLAVASVSKRADLNGFSKATISKVFKSWTHNPSLEDVTVVRAQFSKSVIGIVSNELHGRTGTVL